MWIYFSPPTNLDEGYATHMASESTLRKFLNKESSSGLLLILGAALGLLLANAPTAETYFSILSKSFTIEISHFYLSLSVLKFINYLLMSLFFFVVGMEIKRELISGHLSSIKKAAAPFLAALGGMALPAIIYLAIAGKEGSHGWAIPVATDIALAVGVLTLMGNRVSFAMKTFLLALAVIDDIGAIAIIAFFYSDDLALTWLATGLAAFIYILLSYKKGFNHRAVTALMAVLLWYSFYRSGIHPTLAGVLLGFALPQSEALEEKLHPWSSFLVIPIFALANTGVEVSFESIKSAATSSIAIAIFIALVVGKPLGIFIFTKIFTYLKVAESPEKNGKLDLVATGSAAGIGFTVSIFIAKLAFKEQSLQELAIVAVIFASLISALMSFVLFKSPLNKSARDI
jgi:NhaA family Na+:H+ antiporter